MTSAPVATLTAWRSDIAGGAIAAIVTLPVCIASGILAFAPLGPDYAAAGAAAGLCGAIVTGGVAALVATSSFVVTSPRVSEALLLAGLIAVLLGNASADKNTIVVATFVCVGMAGLWQSIFGLAGVAKIIKFTPHPVLVGFLNGVAVLVVISQLKPYFLLDPVTSRLAVFDRPMMLALLLAVTSLMLFFPVVARKLRGGAAVLANVPPVIVAFGGGIAAYYVLKGFGPGIDIGSTVGNVAVTFVSPLPNPGSFDLWQRVGRLIWTIVPTSVVLAIIATLDTLFAFRTAQNASDLSISPVRDLFAQGISNCAAAVTGGVIGAASPGSTMAAYRAGGRSRVAPVASALILLTCGVFFPAYLAGIPSVVLSGILLSTGILLFERGTFQFVAQTRDGASPAERRRSLYDLAVILIVMSVTVFYSLVAGVFAGVLLAGIIFIMNMSRPVIGRVMFGGEIQSKRIRPIKDVELLRETGPQRAVLLLEGVLFFGNADDLAARVKQLFQQSDLITLDIREVTDIDVSGANILANLVTKSRIQKKDLLFCDVPDQLDGIIKGLVRRGKLGDLAAEDAIKRDLDAALEWMEEKSLALHAGRRGLTDVLNLRDIDFLAGLEGGDLDRLRDVLTAREFAAGDTICREGDDGDRMWLIAKGSVSVRLISPDGRQNRRIASLSRGTTIGEMALVEQARRSATIVADDHVVCYELLREGFNRMLADHPAIGTRLLTNLSRELARRLRRTSQDLRSRN
jgi:MFS superfamily sulfate permease-like transporter